MFAYHRPGGYGDDGKGFAGCILNSPRFAFVQNAGRDLVLGDPDRGILVACKQPQYGKRHVRTAASGAGHNYFGTWPAATDGIERQCQIGIVLVRVVALNFKVLSGINKSATGFAYRVGVAYVYVAAQIRTQQGVQAAIYGDDVVALPCQLAQQFGACHHGRAADY